MWLDGQIDFDYLTQVDSREQWDDLKVIEQDQEDKYFDSVEAQTCLQDGQQSVYTGVLDY